MPISQALAQLPPTPTSPDTDNYQCLLAFFSWTGVGMPNFLAAASMTAFFSSVAKFAAWSFVIADEMANLAGNGEHVFTMQVVAVHGDKLRFIVRVEKTGIVGWQVVEFDLVCQPLLAVADKILNLQKPLKIEMSRDAIQPSETANLNSIASHSSAAARARRDPMAQCKMTVITTQIIIVNKQIAPGCRCRQPKK